MILLKEYSRWLAKAQGTHTTRYCKSDASSSICLVQAAVNAAAIEASAADRHSSFVGGRGTPAAAAAAAADVELIKMPFERLFDLLLLLLPEAAAAAAAAAEALLSSSDAAAAAAAVAV
jgi:hypothetical protein